MAKILHVEDLSEIRKSVGRLMMAMGHQITFAVTLEDAELEMSIEKFDLIICDGTLKSENDGVRWARRLHHSRPEQKILLLSGGYYEGIDLGIPFLHKGKGNLAETVEQILASP